MGTFVGHILPGLTLVLLGLWHTINTIKAYIQRGSSHHDFIVQFWFKTPWPSTKLNCLELIFIFSFSILAILLQILNFPSLDLSFNLTNFEHASIFLHLTIFSSFALCSELSNSSNTLSGFIGVLVASLFGQELFLLHCHSTDHVGIEGHYHMLLQLIVLVSFVSSLLSTCFPSCFPSAFTLSVSVLFQGCWFVNMGFMLWLPGFVTKGCHMRMVKNSEDEMLGAIICLSNEADMRARALANLQFSWIISGILILSGFISLKLAGSENLSTKGQLREYEKLHSGGVDGISLATDEIK